MIKIVRLENLKTHTLGVIIKEGEIVCFTLERPYINNQKDISCIPTGTYNIQKIISPSFGETYKILVEGRTDILLHPGNTVQDTHGCVLVGDTIGFFGPGKRAVLNSRDAFTRFMNILRLEAIDTIEIRNLD